MPNKPIPGFAAVVAGFVERLNQSTRRSMKLGHKRPESDNGPRLGLSHPTRKED